VVLSSIPVLLLRSFLIAQRKGKTMTISKPKMREKASSLWLVRNPSIWNDYQMGTPIEILAIRYNLAIKTIENIVRAFKNCPENPRRWHWEQSQGWKWKPKSLATIRRENRLKFQHRPAPEITKEQNQRGTATYMTFTYKGKEHTVEATTFGAIVDLWNQDRSIASLITKVEVR